MIGRDWQASNIFHSRKILELGLALLIGSLLGLLVVTSPSLPLSSDFQKLVLVIPFIVTVVILFNNLDRVILFALAISVPLNLDVSVVISPYGRNAENMANGRTIVALTGLRVSLILIVVLIGYILWLVKQPKAGPRQVRFYPKITIPALGLILISVLSLSYAQDIQLAFFKIAQLVELFLVFFYLANHLQTKQDLRFFMVVLLVAMLAESLLVIVQWFTGFHFSMAGIEASYEASSGRPGGTLGQPDAAGGIIAAQLALVCALLWYFPRWSQKAFMAICFIAGSAAMITTASRAAWVSFVVILLGFMFLGWRRGWVAGKSLIWLLLITLIIGGIFYPAIYTRLTGDDHGSAASRLLMFKLAWNVIQSSPWNFFLGVGANNYALVAPAYNTIVGGAMGSAIQNISVHNVFLLTWTEIGFIGLLFFLGFLVASLLKAWKHSLSDDRFISLSAIGLGCALVAVNILMLVDPFIARPKMAFLWLLIALIASLDNLDSKSFKPLVARQYNASRT